MIKATHFIVDLETMGNGPRAAIASIGVAVVREGLLTDSTYIPVSLESSVQHGGELDASTVLWWLGQGEEARAAVRAGATPLRDALNYLTDFIRSHSPMPNATYIWGNGSSFDCVILRSAYQAAGLEAPWPFWNDRDLRTLLHLYPAAKALPFEGIKHHALDDARHEAKQLVAALELHADHLRDATKMVTPAGYILAPAEPTPAMVAAAEEAHMPFGDMHIALQCALHAALPLEQTA